MMVEIIQTCSLDYIYLLFLSQPRVLTFLAPNSAIIFLNERKGEL